MITEVFGGESRKIRRSSGAVVASGAMYHNVHNALHLACAEEHGFQEVDMSDRRMLEAAKHFRVAGVNVLGESS